MGKAKFFVDGEDYFKEIYKELQNAEREVFITDWWLSPELYLKRPVNIDDDKEDKYIHKRLDSVLKTLADRDVKIFVLVYKEVEFAGLYNNSVHAKNTLMDLHENIKVIRHPRTLI